MHVFTCSSTERSMLYERDSSQWTVKLSGVSNLLEQVYSLKIKDPALLEKNGEESFYLCILDITGKLEAIAGML